MKEKQNSLEKMIFALQYLGNPEKKLPPAIYVAGTNGKGSCCGFLSSLCKAFGFPYGRFTSPHLLSPEERIAFGDFFISQEELSSLVSFFQHFSHRHKLSLGFFETLTLCAILAFSKRPLDLLIWEAGIGARLDSTNVLKNIHSSVITSISLDHQNILGNTLGDIAFEKSGVMRCHKFCISAPQCSEVLDVLNHEAQKKNCYLRIINTQENFPLKNNLPLLGEHQKINAQCALEALFPQGYPKSLEVFIEKGFQGVSWPGRLMNLKNIFFPHCCCLRDFWLDGAHNEGGFSVLRIFLEEKYTKNGFFQQGILVLGILNRGKPQDAIDILAPLAKEIWIVHDFSQEPSFTSWNVVKKNYPKYRWRDFFSFGDFLDYLRKQWDLDQKFSNISDNCFYGPWILTTGSLYFIGEFLKLLKLS